MKKLLSVIISVALVVGCLVMPASAEGELPELKVDENIAITAVANGSEEVNVATFTPEVSGSYSFEFLETYSNEVGADGEIPGGVVGLNEVGDDYMVSLGFAFFGDVEKLDDDMKQMIIDAGIDIELFARPKFTADLEGGKTYYLSMYQSGANDFTTEIDVDTHEHELQSAEDIAIVLPNGTTDDIGGIYDYCTANYCAYRNYSIIYKQIETTKVSDVVYNGKAQTPAVKIKTTDGENLDSKYYSVSYENNKNIGSAKAIITFTGGYIGTVTKTFKINPKATKIKKVSKAKKSVTVKYAKVSGVSGYEIQLAKNKSFTKGKKTVTVKSGKTVSKKIKVANGKKYYARVRSYKKVSGKKYYSAWTKAK